jgi:hypothetical protein
LGQDKSRLIALNKFIGKSEQRRSTIEQRMHIQIIGRGDKREWLIYCGGQAVINAVDFIGLVEGQLEVQLPVEAGGAEVGEAGGPLQLLQPQPLPLPLLQEIPAATVEEDADDVGEDGPGFVGKDFSRKGWKDVGERLKRKFMVNVLPELISVLMARVHPNSHDDIPTILEHATRCAMHDVEISYYVKQRADEHADSCGPWREGAKPVPIIRNSIDEQGMALGYSFLAGFVNSHAYGKISTVSNCFCDER